VSADHRIHVTGWDDGPVYELECLHGPDEFVPYYERPSGPCRCIEDFPPGCTMCLPVENDDDPDHYGCENYGEANTLGPECQTNPGAPGECWLTDFWNELGTENIHGVMHGPPPWDMVTEVSADEYPEMGQDPEQAKARLDTAAS
jgi:hypothetical protein